MCELRRWVDEDGTEAVLYNGRLSLSGKPSMTASDGSVVLGIDLPVGLLAPPPSPPEEEVSP